jgi:hypothetical protein
MRSLATLILFFSSIQFVCAQFQYISPVPGSQFHNPDCSVILREGNPINAGSLLNKDIFYIHGSISGSHHIIPRLCDDQKTINLKPVPCFTEGETVTVIIKDGIQETGGEIIPGCKFTFEIHPKRTEEENQRIAAFRKQLFEGDFGTKIHHESPFIDRNGFPNLSIDINTTPAPGDVFFYNFNFDYVDNMYMCIISSDADSVYCLHTQEKGSTFDLNHNGYITVYNYDSVYFEMWDSSYHLLNSYKPGNGYATDAHDFLIFPDGHSFILGFDQQIVDMTVYDSTYQTNATVSGAILQELDSNKNVIFEWRSWDHIDITEALHQNLAGLTIDAVHPNAIEKDADGNILLSCRVLDQVLKINRQTGETIWRLGGQKNEFTFINDSSGFTYQHDIRRLSNGNITIFDNGNWHNPPKTTAKEYEIDEVNKTAKLVWSYNHPPVSGNPVISLAMGNVQRLPNGNTFIGWGYITPGSGGPNVSEVDSNGNPCLGNSFYRYYNECHLSGTSL